MNLQTALLQGQRLLEDRKIDAPRLTAEVLLAHAIGCERSWLYAHSSDDLRELWWIHYGRYLHQRLNGVPTQHITGKQEFYGRNFHVTADVLIPRPETEHLVETALERCANAGSVLDIGTGSGVLAVTLALETGAHVAATDISSAALKVAAANSHGLRANVDFVCCDLASALRDESFALVVSNPPYIPRHEAPGLAREVREHEPAIALFGGEDGMEVYRRLIPEARRLLQPAGWLMMEIAFNGESKVVELLQGWREISVVQDLAGFPRVVVARRS